MSRRSTRSIAAAPTSSPSRPSSSKSKTTKSAPTKMKKEVPEIKTEHDISEIAAIHGGEMTLDVGKEEPKQTNGSKKRKRGDKTNVKEEETVDPKMSLKDEMDAAVDTVLNTPSKRSRTNTTTPKGKVELESETTPSKSATKPKTPSSANKKYNLTPGVTPFPNFPHPTPEECEHVVDLLSKRHGRPVAPTVIPTPSTTSAGCGQVPSVLDALIRTLMSAATNLQNSSRAFRNLVEHYGLLEDGIGKGSVDWEKVRQGSLEELFETIKCGGLAGNKSKNIKAILDMVYEENVEMMGSASAKKEEDTPQGSSAGSTSKDENTKKPLLSLDHLHDLPTPEAMVKLTSYPGIGVKTASCTLLFCMSRPSFAVDTHVWRLCKWLGWVPEKANRDDTYRHCDVRIPDDLKYTLHFQFWREGRYCSKCSLIPQKSLSEAHEDISSEPCPLEALIKAKGGRKKADGSISTPRSSASKKQKTFGSALVKGKKKGRKQMESDESDEAEMSESEEEDEDGDYKYDPKKGMLENGVTTKEYID